MNGMVLVTGNFNVLHPGHIRLLKFAKSFEMKLVVGVNSDRIAGSLVDSSETLRKEAVSSINIVDECFLVDEPIHQIGPRKEDRVRERSASKSIHFHGHSLQSLLPHHIQCGYSEP